MLATRFDSQERSGRPSGTCRELGAWRGPGHAVAGRETALLRAPGMGTGVVRRGGSATAGRSVAGGGRGAVLLDVVVALGLFVMAATVVVSGMSASVNSTFRMGKQLTAENLAVTVMSEMASGMRAVESDGPEPFEAPYEQWTWEVRIEPMPSGQATSGLRNVEVVITHEQEDLRYRLNQFLAIDPSAAGEGSLLERLEELDAGFD